MLLGYFAVSKMERAISGISCLRFLRKFREDSMSYRFDVIQNFNLTIIVFLVFK